MSAEPGKRVEFAWDVLILDLAGDQLSGIPSLHDELARRGLRVKVVTDPHDDEFCDWLQRELRQAAYLLTVETEGSGDGCRDRTWFNGAPAQRRYVEERLAALQTWNASATRRRAG